MRTMLWARLVIATAASFLALPTHRLQGPRVLIFIVANTCPARTRIFGFARVRFLRRAVGCLLRHARPATSPSTCFAATAAPQAFPTGTVS